MGQNFEELQFHTAREFLEALRKSDPRWLEDGRLLSDWFFRGQGSSEWRLAPSAWREDIQSDSQFNEILDSITDQDIDQLTEEIGSAVPGVDREVIRLHAAYKNFEFWQTATFAHLVDELGMHIPGGYLSRPQTWELFPLNGVVPQPHPVYALSQHHGMKTRLLDWTQNPLFAAFFACEKPDDIDGAIAVWALQRHALQGRGNWIEFRVPRSQIGFLHSQAGLFTFHRFADHHFLTNGVWPSLEDDPDLRLVKLVLPSTEAHELRRLLFVESVSRVHLMPTLDNIRNTLQRLWTGESSRLKNSAD